MDIGLFHYMVLSTVLFILGVLGIFVNRKNIIIVFMCIELLLLAVNINFVSFSFFLQDLVGQVMVIFILTVAAAEASIGLAILVMYFRHMGSIDVETVDTMKG